MTASPMTGLDSGNVSPQTEVEQCPVEPEPATEHRRSQRKP
jgi:hypothetical protein